MNKTLLDIIAEISAAYDNEYTLEELKNKKIIPKIQEENGQFLVAQKQCFYGGCEFDYRAIDSEYEAYKNAYIRTMFLAARQISNKNSSTKVVDINTECPKLDSCSGRDDS